MKTNGARFLESLGIPFELREYEVDPKTFPPSPWQRRSACRAEQVFKTLLTTTANRAAARIYRFAVIPGNAELDFKKLGRAPPAFARPRWLRLKTCSRSPATSVAELLSSAQKSLPGLHR